MRRTAWVVLLFLSALAPVSAQTAGAPQGNSAQEEPAAPTLRPEHLVSFDSRQAELRWVDGHWQLVAGTVWLKDFGRREADARAALRAIQTLQLTQHGTIGTPVPVMEYWLTDGQAPHGIPGAGRMETLDLNSLRIEQLGNQWELRDNRHRLFTFGPYKEDAEQALAVIRHYHFTRLGVIGPTLPTMVYFTGDDAGLSRSRLLVPAQKDTKKPAPAGNAQETKPQRWTFDYRLVQVKQDQNEWMLVFGSHVLANLGNDRQAAQQALSFFQHYRFTEQILIGQPPTFSYFLVGGQAPRGLQFGVAAESFFPDAVQIRHMGNQWLVCEGDRPLVNFGDHHDDARQLVLAIQRHRFDRLCRIGGTGPGQSLTFLIRER